MGATLPGMDRFVCRLRAEGRSVGSLYGANTLGAVHCWTGYWPPGGHVRAK